MTLRNFSSLLIILSSLGMIGAMFLFAIFDWMIFTAALIFIYIALRDVYERRKNQHRHY